MDNDAAFRRWLAHKSWCLTVRYCKVVALLLPPAALATDLPLLRRGAQGVELAGRLAARRRTGVHRGAAG